MKYNTETALEYSKKGEIDKWLQLFLRDDNYEHANPNIPLADGLLLEERFYYGPILIDFDKITPKRIEEHITGNDLNFYKEKVDGIINNYTNIDLPPLILEYKDDKLYLVDGNHRYSVLKKLNIDKYYAIIWGNKDKEKDFLGEESNEIRRSI